MNVESKGAQTVSISAVQDVVAEGVKDATDKIGKALMKGLQEKLNFKGLAEKHISATYVKDLSSCDEKTQMVYRKLFAATSEHIQTKSQLLVMSFQMMNQQTGNAKAHELFLQSFVLPAAKSVVQRLEAEHPKALENKEIWN